MITYQGKRTRNGTLVIALDDLKRKTYLDVSSYDADVIGFRACFDWGYIGVEGAMLAFVLLRHHFEHTRFPTREAMNDAETLALNSYTSFASSVIAQLPREGWELNSEQIAEHLRIIRERRNKIAPLVNIIGGDR